MKRFKKFMASLLVAVMLLTTAPLSGFAGVELNFDWFDFIVDSIAADTTVFSLNKVSETADKVVIEVKLESGGFAAVDFGIEYNEDVIVKCTEITAILSGGFAVSNPATGLYSAFVETGFKQTGAVIATYTFEKVAGATVFNEDIAMLIDCCTSVDNQSIQTVVINNIPADDSIITSGDCGTDVHWSFNVNGVLRIYGTGNMANYSSTTLPPWNDYKDDIKSVVINNGVTSIGNDTFVGCKNLTSVSIPETVTQIGNTAFRDCTNLPSIVIPGSVTSIGYYAFYGCTGLKVIEIPYGVTTISNYAFANCTGLTTVAIPVTVTTIAKNAFYKCSSVNNVTYKGTQSQWSAITIGEGNEAITDNVGIITASGICGTLLLWQLVNGEKLIITGNGAMRDYYSNSAPWYSYRSQIKSVVMGNGVTSIGDYAFYGCSSLESVELPDSITLIGSDAFYGCSKLTEIRIPDGVESIESYAFYACACLERIELPASLKSIGYEAFAYTSIKELVIPNSVTSINGCILEGNSDIERLTVPFLGSNRNSTATLNYMFGYSYYDNHQVPETLKTVNITNATKIGNYAFRNCSSIENITLNEGITSIGSYAFYQCSSLKEITIPDTVTNISDCAFNGCTAMKVVDLGNNPDLQINYNVFDGCDSVERYSIGSSSINYCTDEYGVLYNKNKSGLIRYTTGNSRTEYTVDSNVAYINENAFENSVNLKKVNLPKDIMSIGLRAFGDCTALEEIIIPDGTDTVCFAAFEGCTSIKEITIPESLSVLGNYAFKDCVSVEKINYDAINLNSDETRTTAFENCGTATDGFEVVFSDSVVNIPEGLFEGRYEYHWNDATEECEICGIASSHYCRYNVSPNIRSITVGSNVKTIGYGAFCDNETLTDLNFNATNCDVASCAFTGCSALSNVVIGEGVTKIPSDFITGCSAVVDVVIPESVKEIGDFAFSNNYALVTVRFNTTDEIIIGDDIFQGSYKAMICCKENSFLHSYATINGIKFAIVDDADSPNFEIKNNVLISYNGRAEDIFVSAASEIGYGAFKNNTQLKRVELSSGATRIYDKAFAGCSALETVIIPQNVSAIGDSAFEGCNNLTIYGYAGSFAESYAKKHGIDFEYITLTVSAETFEVNVFDTLQLVTDYNVFLSEADEIVWSCDDNGVVSVSSTGKVTANKEGEAVVTATSESGLFATCVIKVTAAGTETNGKVNSVTIDDIALDYKGSATIVPSISADAGVGYTVNYSSSNPSVASVDENGKVSTGDTGSATITVVVTDEYGNTVTDTCEVSVDYNWWQWILVIVLFGWIWY